MGTLAQALELARAKLTDGYFGPRTTTKVVNDHERVEPDGLTLIGKSGSSSDAYSLARLIASECGTQPLTYQWCVAEATRNSAQAAGISIFSRVTNPGAAYPAANKGYYGEQRTRWASTKQDPKVAHHEVALAVLSNPSMNLAKGARRWISCKVQDGGVQNGRPLSNDAKGIQTSWAKDGYQWVGPIFEPQLGQELIDPYLLCLFEFVGQGKADPARGLAMVDERRRSSFTAKNVEPGEGGARDMAHVGVPVMLFGAAAALGLAHWKGMV